jgi:hypothetical protein
MTAAVATPRRPADLWQTLWLALGSPWLLLGLAGWLTLLLLVSLWLPQMPDYLREEGSAASRWLLAAATPYGAFGTLARGLGFFDMLHSPLLLAPLAALILVLLVQIVQQISAAQALRRLPAVLDAAGVNGEPLSLHSPYRLLRWRSAVADTALSQTGQMQMLLQARFVRLERRTMRVAPAPATVDPARSAADSGDGAAPVLEERLLALRGQQAVLLRPLFLAGMLCAALYLWAASALAWHFEAPFLIPGAPAVDSVHDLSLQYELARPVDGVLTPRLRIALGDDSVAAVVASRVEAQVAGVEVVAAGRRAGIGGAQPGGRRRPGAAGSGCRCQRAGAGLPRRRQRGDGAAAGDRRGAAHRAQRAEHARSRRRCVHGGGLQRRQRAAAAPLHGEQQPDRDDPRARAGRPGADTGLCAAARAGGVSALSAGAVADDCGADLDGGRSSRLPPAPRICAAPGGDRGRSSAP